MKPVNIICRYKDGTEELKQYPNVPLRIPFVRMERFNPNDPPDTTVKFQNAFLVPRDYFKCIDTYFFTEENNKEKSVL